MGTGTVLFLVANSLPFVCAVFAAAVYINDREMRQGKGRSIALYCAGVLMSGLAGVLLAGFFVVPAFCSYYHGEQCSFGAGVISLPLFFSVAVAMFVYLWKMRNNGRTT